MAITRPPLIPTTPKKTAETGTTKTKSAVTETNAGKTDDAVDLTTFGCTKKMSVTLEDGAVVIRMPLQKTPTISSTGKSQLYCSTRGPRRVVQKTKDNTYVPVEIDGGVLKAIASAFVTLAPTSVPNTRTIVKRKKKQ